MKIINIITIAALMCVTQISLGHSDHYHGSQLKLDKAEFEGLAKGEIQRLKDLNKLDTSWLEAKVVESKKSGSFWLVAFKNDKVKEIEKSHLYVYVKLDGKSAKATYDKM